jgi:hypothetical protein
MRSIYFRDEVHLLERGDHPRRRREHPCVSAVGLSYDKHDCLFHNQRSHTQTSRVLELIREPEFRNVRCRRALTEVSCAVWHGEDCETVKLLACDGVGGVFD